MALAAGLPGIIMLLVTPLVIYPCIHQKLRRWITKPSLKRAFRTGTDENPRKNAARCLCAGVLGWIFSKSLGVDESTVAIVLWQLCCCWVSLPGKTWLKIKRLEYLNLVRRYYRLKLLIIEVKFFEWLAEVFKNNLAFDGTVTLLSSLLFSSASSCVISSFW